MVHIHAMFSKSLVLLVLCLHGAQLTLTALSAGTVQIKRLKEIKRVKRSAVKHYDHCPGGQSVTAPPGKTCARVYWHEPSEESSRKSGGNPGDCFRAGDHRIKYEYDGALGWHWTNGDECSFTIRVTVHYCSSNPRSIAHGSRHCTGDSDRVYGSVCHYTCQEGYLLQGPSSVTCQRNSGYMQWSNTFPTECRLPTCNPGEGRKGSSCAPCAVGWWNSGNDTQRFEPCTPCPGGYVTAAEGAIDPHNCSVPCPEGTYGAYCASNCTCNTNNTATCNATNGQCVCNTGWQGSECTDDVDECSLMPLIHHPCPDRSVCTNTNGSFVCQCLDGFDTANDTCVACPEGTYGAYCASNCTCNTNNTATCNATNGQCVCNTGWQGSECTDDVDECSLMPLLHHPCQNRSVCTNTNGSFVCQCSDGFAIANSTCVDIDECHEKTDGCEQRCVNDEGSFYCDCDPGYLLHSANKCQVACNAGEGWNGSSCVPCAVGWWNSGNDTQRFEPCTPCPGNYSTAAEGANDPYNCSVWACNPGKHFNNSSCVPCKVGWWNSGNDTQRFEPCTPCSEGYVTATEGAIDPHNCSVRDCSPGEFIDGLRGELCSPCAVDSYQNKARQNHCRPCPPGTHTKTTGSSSLSDCIAPPGEKNTASMNLKYALVVVCTSREANSVRQTLRARVLGLRSEWPDMCPDSSCSNAQVSASCAGPNSKAVIAVVKLEELPATLTSLSTGSTMTTENMLLASAVKDDAFELPESFGATLQRDDIRIALEKTCAVGFQRFGDTCDCGEGTFKRVANDSVMCDVCPAGSYQDKPGKYSCNPCPAGTSTTTTGADEQSDCTPTGKAVADTSTSGSGVSAALIGSIIGGLMGLLAVLLVVFTVYRVFKQGGPMQTFLAARRSHEEHGYSGLFSAQATHGYGDKEGIEMRQHMRVPASLILPELPPRFSNGEEVYDYIADDDTARYVTAPLRQAKANAPDDVSDECYLHAAWGENTSAEIDSQYGPFSSKPKLYQSRQQGEDGHDSGSDEDLDTPPADYEDNVIDMTEEEAKSTREDGHGSESDEDLDAPPADYEDNVFDMAEK